MKMPAQAVELALEFCRIQVEAIRQSEKCEVIDRGRRLHFAALLAELRRAHVAARPAIGLRRLAGTGDQDAAIGLVIGVDMGICGVILSAALRSRCEVERLRGHHPHGIEVLRLRVRPSRKNSGGKSGRTLRSGGQSKNGLLLSALKRWNQTSLDSAREDNSKGFGSHARLNSLLKNSSRHSGAVG